MNGNVNNFLSVNLDCLFQTIILTSSFYFVNLYISPLYKSTKSIKDLLDFTKSEENVELYFKLIKNSLENNGNNKHYFCERIISHETCIDPRGCTATIEWKINIKLNELINYLTY